MTKVDSGNLYFLLILIRALEKLKTLRLSLPCGLRFLPGVVILFSVGFICQYVAILHTLICNLHQKLLPSRFGLQQTTDILSFNIFIYG